MTASWLQYQQRDSSGYARQATIVPPVILHGPLVTLRRKGYQGRSPWLVGPPAQHPGREDVGGVSMTIVSGGATINKKLRAVFIPPSSTNSQKIQISI